MAGVREKLLCLHCTQEQKAEVESRAAAAGLTVSNYLRSLLGWPQEKQGQRKDLTGPQGGDTAGD